jgi:hypothetical protein
MTRQYLSNRYSNPGYWVNLNDNPNIETDYFVDTSIYPHPDKRVNLIFTFDLFHLKNVETGLTMDNIEPTTTVSFSKETPREIQIFYPTIDVSDGFLTEVILNDNAVVLAQSHNNLVISPDFSEDGEIKKQLTYVPKLDWRMDAVWDAFLLHAIGKKTEEPITYQDKFHLTFLEYYLGLDEQNNLSILGNDLSELKAKKSPIEFSFVSQEEVYYCDQGKCTSVLLEDTTPGPNYSATYKGNSVYRSTRCFGQCSKENFQTSKPSMKKDLILFAVVIGLSLLLLGVHLWFKKRNHL